tara:strand:- start:103 stop:681 length:579 start_codon:yes stop_codon:yes gene_type:complete
MLPPQHHYARMRLEREILEIINDTADVTSHEIERDGMPIAGPSYTTYELRDSNGNQKGTVSIGGRINYVQHELDPSLSELVIKLEEYSNETCDQKRYAYAQEYTDIDDEIKRRLNSIRSREVKDYEELSDVHNTARFLGCSDILSLYEVIEVSDEENIAQSLNITKERIAEIKDQLREIIGEDTIKLYENIY